MKLHFVGITGRLAVCAAFLCFISTGAPAQETSGENEPSASSESTTPQDSSPDDSSAPDVQEQEAEPDEEASTDHELPEITVQAPYEAPPAQPTPSRTTSAPAPASVPAPRAVEIEAAPAGNAETAWGPVDGYIATRSGTGLKTDTPLDEIPQSITVVTRDEMDDQGVTSVQDALRYVPGVFAGSYGFDIRGDSARIRGSDPIEYLDGLRRIYGYYNNTRIEPYTLERIEVLKGPASVLYGAGSTAGILNLVSKRPQDEPAGEIGVIYGSHDYRQVQGDVTGKVTQDGKWLYRLVGVGRLSNTQVDYVEYDRYAFAPSLTWRPDDKTNITVLASFQKDKSGSSAAFLPWSGTLLPNPNGRIPTRRFTGEPTFDAYDTERQEVTLLAERQLNDVFTFRQGMRYTNSKVEYESLYPDVFSNPSDPFLDPQRRTVGRISWASYPHAKTFNSDSNLVAKFNTGPLKHKLLGGVDYTRFSESRSEGSGYVATPFDLYDPVYGNFTRPQVFRSPDNGTIQTGVYAQDQIDFGRWIAVLGIRHDEVDQKVQGSPDETNEATTYRAGLMYRFDNGFTPYVSYIQSFDPIFGVNAMNVPFKPLEGEQWEIGFKYQPNGQPFVINGALYDIVESNRLASDPSNPFNQIQIGEARTRGAEIETIFTYHEDLDVIAGYSYTDSEITAGDGEGFPLETTPQHQASLWATYRFDLFGIQGFSVGGGVRYVGSSFVAPNVKDVPSFTLFDAMISYETEHWKYQINATNLTDEEYVATCLGRGDCWYGDRRMVLGTISYKF